MANSVKYALYLLPLLSSCACATVKSGEKSHGNESQAEKITVSPGSPNREGFVPLAPPVIVDGSPNVEKKK